MARFGIRARTVDMLGRQQISGIPTAVSELFKNAHDAGAEHVRVDFLRHRDLFVLRDDGCGMTPDEFQSRWLTLGSDSKLGDGPAVRAARSKGRAVLGEKGIGRLAIAAIGRQVLVLTRSREPGSPLVAAYLHWGLFEAPGIDLDDIDIPVELMEDLPDGKAVKRLVRRAVKHVESLRTRIGDEAADELVAEMKAFSVDPVELSALGAPSLANDGAGTHFYLGGIHEAVGASLEPEGDKPSRLVKFLCGFVNVFDPERPDLRIAFWDHRGIDDAVEIIDEAQFWESRDWDRVDHLIEGGFDAEGRWAGTVRVFGGQPIAHEIAPPKEFLTKAAKCGPFTIRFGYVQGETKHTHLDPETHGYMEGRLQQFAGLYIYRNGIRVQPYGDPEYDFLRIEQRRSQNAGHYFFSYRRLFGAISISIEDNSALREKAGREGFQENAAYRDFRDLLEHLFLQLAADFFRRTAKATDLFVRRKAELEAAHTHQKESAQRRASFVRTLGAAITELEDGLAGEALSAVRLELDRALDKARRGRAEPLGPIGQARDTALRKIAGIEGRMRVDLPGDLALEPEQQRDWSTYLYLWGLFERDDLDPGKRHVHEAVEGALIDTGSPVDPREVAAAVLREREERGRDVLATVEQVSNSLIEQFRQGVRVSLDQASSDFEGVIGRLWQEQADAPAEKLDPDWLVNAERQAEGAVQLMRRRLDVLQRRIDAATSRLRGVEALDQEDVAVVLEEELLALRDRAAADLQLAQLGTAVEIINHEFSASIRAVRNNLRRLGAWGQSNPDLAKLTRDLTASFQHLDSYLTLFTPLHRRLQRARTTFTGGDIATYVHDLFTERFERDDIEFEVTDAFRKFPINGYPSTFYPVFVNLVDNACFWVGQRRQPRVIRLDADDEGLVVADNGPGVSPPDQEAIFEMGFSRKPGGRGMGLHISKKVLEGEHWDLGLLDCAEGAAFRVAPRDGEGRDGVG